MLNNTLIEFQSDNGGTRNPMFAGAITDMTKVVLPADNGPYRDGKGTLYEGGIARRGGRQLAGCHIKEGSVVNDMLHWWKSHPTLSNSRVEISSAKQGSHGLDVWGTISEGKPSPRTELVYNIEPFRAAIREAQLIWRTLLPQSVELFNITKDPSETTGCPPTQKGRRAAGADQ